MRDRQNKVPGTGYFPHIKAKIQGLAKHRVVEYEIVGVFQQGYGLRRFSAEGSVSGVVSGKFLLGEQVLGRS